MPDQPIADPVPAGAAESQPGASSALPPADGRPRPSASPSTRRAVVRWAASLQPWLYGVLAVLLVLSIELVIEGFAERTERARVRAAGFEYLAGVRSRLEGVLNVNLLMVHGLDAVIIAHPEIGQAEFSRIARGMVGEGQVLRNLAAAPNLVISMVYPLEGNAGALGLDFRTHPTQRETAMRAVRTHGPVVAGPLTLAQGGVGIIAREAVYLPGTAPGEEARLWGLISGVIDVDELYRLADVRPGDPDWSLAIRGTDGTGPSGPVFLGDPQLFTGDSMRTEVRLPGGSWQLAAAPAAGWTHTSQAVHLIRLLGAISALLVGVLAWRVSAGARSLSSTLARVGSLMDTLPDLAWMKGPDGRYLWFNRGFANMVGVPDQQVLGRTDAQLFNAALAARFTASDLQAIRTRAPVRVESTVPFAGLAKTALVDTIKAPVYDARGRLLGVLGFSRDITDLRETERRARLGEIVLDSLFQAIPDLFFLMDADGTIRDYRAQRGSDPYVSPETFLGHRMQDVVPAEPARQFTAALAGLEAGESLITYEYDMVLPAGTRHFEARLSRLPGSTQVIAVVRDVTERHLASVELEQRVRERTAEIAAVNQQLETFAYLVSHDLKAPLRGIDGYSRLLLEDHSGALDPEGLGFVANIREGVNRMGELIEDLLAYSRAERRTFREARLPLAETLRSVLKAWQDELDCCAAEVTVEVGSLAVRADPEGFKMVIGNLVDNAVKFRRPGRSPAIDIRAQVRDDRVIVTVHDQGIGFDMRFHERIFEIFQRLQRSEDFPGTGVGLAIVRKAMERMGGRVWAESVPGEGATFHLDFPA